MFCPNCGAPNPDAESQCGSCGTYLSTTAPTQGVASTASAYPGSLGAPAGPVETHMVAAVLTTLFCCMPFGIAAIVYASQVNGKLVQGDYAGARTASQKAKGWANISMICGLVLVLLQVLVVVVGG